MPSTAARFIHAALGDSMQIMASGDGRRPGRVKMSDDLRQGRVFFSHFEGKAHAADAIKGFQSAEGFIRRNIGRALGLRYTPQFDFEFDPGLENAARIDALLRESRARD
jgi:ribosome-binding factor A